MPIGETPHSLRYQLFHRLGSVIVEAKRFGTSADFRGLRKLKDACGPRFVAGVVLYDGETTVGFGEGLHAVPIRTLWETK